MPRIVALYRYPVKGFTPEACKMLTVLDEGRISGDLVLGIRFANSGVLDDVWSKKHEFIALVNAPGLACLKLQFDSKALRLYSLVWRARFWLMKRRMITAVNELRRRSKIMYSGWMIIHFPPMRIVYPCVSLGMVLHPAIRTTRLAK